MSPSSSAAAPGYDISTWPVHSFPLFPESWLMAGCAKLTDISVIEIVEHLPKLRRIGLVKVSRS